MENIYGSNEIEDQIDDITKLLRKGKYKHKILCKVLELLLEVEVVLLMSNTQSSKEK